MSRLSSLLNRVPILPLALCLVVGVVVVVGPKVRQRLDVDWPDQRLMIETVVISEPVVKERAVVVDLLTTDGNRKLKCRLARDSYAEQVRLGDGLLIQSKVNKVHAWQQGHFDYQRYMACHGFSGEMWVNPGEWQQKELSLAGLSLLQRTKLHFLLWRHQLLDHYRQWGVTDEAYGVVAAMTLGEKSQLDGSLKEI